MKITYNPLWKLLIDKGIKKGELCKLAGVSPATITKMGNGAHINTDTIVKICSALHCGITDIIELVEDQCKWILQVCLYQNVRATHMAAALIMMVIQNTTG